MSDLGVVSDTPQLAQPRPRLRRTRRRAPSQRERRHLDRLLRPAELPVRALPSLLSTPNGTVSEIAEPLVWSACLACLATHRLQGLYWRLASRHQVIDGVEWRCMQAGRCSDRLLTRRRAKRSAVSVLRRDHQLWLWPSGASTAMEVSAQRSFHPGDPGAPPAVPPAVAAASPEPAAAPHARHRP